MEGGGGGGKRGGCEFLVPVPCSWEPEETFSQFHHLVDRYKSICDGANLGEKEQRKGEHLLCLFRLI